MTPYPVSVPKTGLAIPPGSLVLVTGANGFIGSHVADALLAAGYRVRGTARDAEKVRWISEFFHSRYSKEAFECVVVKEMQQEGAFDDAVKDCAGIAHIASDVTFGANPREVIPPVLAGVRNILRAVSRTPTVKRVVLCSSSAAARASKVDLPFHISSTSWNDEAIAAAPVDAPPPYDESFENRIRVYGASKALGEQACWDFVRDNNPGFVLNTVLPNFTIGEILVPAHQAGSSAGLISGAYNNEPRAEAMLRAFTPQWYVGVKDVGLLHLAALVCEDVKGERLFAFSGHISHNIVMATLRRLYPEKNFPEDMNNEGKNLSTVENGRAEELLKRFGRPRFMDLEETFQDLDPTRKRAELQW